MNFHLKEKPLSHLYVTSCVRALQLYPKQDILSAGHIITYNKQLIDRVLLSLNPTEARIHVIWEKYECATTQIKHCSYTNYKRIHMPRTVFSLSRATNDPLDIEFKLFSRNEYIAKSYVKPINIELIDNPRFVSREYTTLWLKTSNKFIVPQAEMIFLFSSEFSLVDAATFNLIYMYTRLVSLSLNKYSYGARMANLKWKIHTNKRGIQTYINNMSKEQFEKHKEALIEKYCQEPTTLSSVAAACWDEIYNNIYCFKRRSFNVMHLESMQQDQFTNLYKSMLLNERKISVHVISTQNDVSRLPYNILFHGSQLKLIANGNANIINNDKTGYTTSMKKVTVMDNIMIFQKFHCLEEEQKKINL
ncbi:PREDICTED: insulin-degrading enzyme-like [Dinoponera quadriceps]|uniref:Insulin-degrading enzyme-like n=1 Tax=Dinoponera quadriceps TaxID=609295 RepID=A0A6P3Y8V5_DINQU|nr:PREDICTED: insulin-degrading enzyme-like [Dinoponera quadriceps]